MIKLYEAVKGIAVIAARLEIDQACSSIWTSIPRNFLRSSIDVFMLNHIAILAVLNASLMDGVCRIGLVLQKVERVFIFVPSQQLQSNTSQNVFATVLAMN